MSNKRKTGIRHRILAAVLAGMMGMSSVDVASVFAENATAEPTAAPADPTPEPESTAETKTATTPIIQKYDENGNVSSSTPEQAEEEAAESAPAAQTPEQTAAASSTVESTTTPEASVSAEPSTSESASTEPIATADAEATATPEIDLSKKITISEFADPGKHEITISSEESTKENIENQFALDWGVTTDDETVTSTDVVWDDSEYVEHTSGTFDFYPLFHANIVIPDDQYENVPYYEVTVTMSEEEQKQIEELQAAADEITAPSAEADEETADASEAKPAPFRARRAPAANNTLLSELAGYTPTNQLGESKSAGKEQKNYQEAAGNAAGSFLYKSAHWTDFTSGQADIDIYAAEPVDSNYDGNRAVFIFTDCPSHGFTKGVAASRLQELLKSYQYVDLITITGPYDDGIVIHENISNFTDGWAVLNSLPWRGGDHFSLNVYAGLYKYLYGSYDSTTQTRKPAAIYAAFDMLYEPCDYAAAGGFAAVSGVGVCDAYGPHYRTQGPYVWRYDSSGQAYSNGNAGRTDSPIWDLLKQYKADGRYYSLALDGTTKQQDYMSVWENTDTPRAADGSDAWRVNIIEGIAQPQNYDAATATTPFDGGHILAGRAQADVKASDWMFAYKIEHRYAADYMSPNGWISSDIPQPASMVISDVVSDQYTIDMDNISASDSDAKIYADQRTGKVIATFPNYKPGDIAHLRIHVYANYGYSADWVDTNTGDATSGTTVQVPAKTVNPTKLSRTAYQLTINYLRKSDSAVLKPSYTGMYYEGETYSIDSPERLALYEIVDRSQLTVAGTMPAHDVVVDVYYDNMAYTTDEIKVRKIVKGEVNNSDEFTFKIEPKTSTTTKTVPMPERDTVTVVGNSEGSFGTITFKEDGVYSYKVYEVNSGGAYTYDSHAYTLTYTVKSGKCVLSVTKASDIDMDSQEFNYTGGIQEFTAPVDGLYTLEVYGAEGGSAENLNNAYTVLTAKGGNGGYATGQVVLNAGDKLYIAVGEKGPSITMGSNNTYFGVVTTSNYAFNGGGNTGTYIASGSDPSGHSGGNTGGGGGATSIQTSLIGDGQLANYKNDKDKVLIVAGGGGAGAGYNQMYGSYESDSNNGGAGGGETGDNGEKGTWMSKWSQNLGGGQTEKAGSYFGYSHSENGSGWYSGYSQAGSSGGAAGGAGGSGYVGGVVSGTMQNGVRSGNGYVKISYPKAESWTGELTFTNIPNTTVTPGTVEIGVNKNIVPEVAKGAMPYENHSFTFNIAPASANADTSTLQSEIVINTNAKDYGVFGTVTCRQPGTYQYKITEKAGTGTPFIYDNGYVIATVKAVKEGSTIKSSVSYKHYNADGSGEADGNTFTNTYYSYDLTVNKTGMDASDVQTATFILFHSGADKTEYYKLTGTSGNWTISGIASGEADATRINVGADAKLNIHGLLGQEYILKEVSADDAYVIPDEATLVTFNPISGTNPALSKVTMNMSGDYKDGDRHATIEIENIPADFHKYKDVFASLDDAKTGKHSINKKYVGDKQILTYKIYWENTTSAARYYDIEDAIPENSTYVENSMYVYNGTGSAAYDSQNNMVTFHEVQVGAAKSKTEPTIGYVTFQVKAVGSPEQWNKIENQASVWMLNSSGSRITKTDPNTNAVVNYIMPQVLDKTTLSKSVTLTADPNSQDMDTLYIKKGDIIYYHVRIKGLPIRADVTLTDVIPNGLEYVSGSADNGGTYSSANRTMTWNMSVAPKSTVTVTFGVKATVDSGDFDNHAVLTINSASSESNHVTNQAALITINKTIENYYEPFGKPSFVYKITGSNGSVNYRMIPITNPKAGATDATTFAVPTGTAADVTWTVDELKSARYALKSVSSGSTNTVQNGNQMIVTPVAGNRPSVINYVNTVDDWSEYSHEDSALNHVKSADRNS